LSKTMVALGLATLVTRGEMSWSDPVRRWLGKEFSLGPNEYVSDSLNVKDLLAHRTGLAEGQGGFSAPWLPMPEFLRSLKFVEPVNTLRDTFAYSNTGWVVAGEVLRAASNSSSWCEGLHKTLLQPLNLTRTFCHRNEVPAAVSAKHLAAVHKMDPCSGKGHLSTYEFVATGAPTDFAWGAADAAGSVISSVKEMSTILKLLLGVTSAKILDPMVLQGMLTGQMTTPSSWATGCGLAGWGKGTDTAGRAAAAGLGFDFAGEIELMGKRFSYAEKNGDTDMHKARLGLLPDLKVGVLLLSNLGGHMGGPLTGLKFGALVKLAGGTDAEANMATEAALNTTGFWEDQWVPSTTCTACGTAGSSKPCIPSGINAPPLPLGNFVGKYGTPAYGKEAVTLEARDSMLLLTFGAVKASAVSFSNTSFVLQESCATVAATLEKVSVPWAASALSLLGALSGGNCTLVEWVVPPEIPAGGVSARRGTVAFPLGCGIVPLPDGPSVYAVAHEGQGVLVSIGGEALPRSDHVAKAEVNVI